MTNGGCCGLRRSAQDEFAWRHATMAHEDEENKKLWAQPRAEAALRSGNWQLQMADPATTEGWSLIRAYLARMIDKDMSLSAMLVTPFFLVGGGFLLAVAWDTWANGGLDRLLTMTAGRVTMLVYLVMMLGCMYAVAILDRLISGKFARQAIVVDEAIAQCKRRREHTNSSHTTKHAELSKAIALLKVTQSECKFNAARKSAASVFLRLQWVGVALSGGGDHADPQLDALRGELPAVDGLRAELANNLSSSAIVARSRRRNATAATRLLDRRADERRQHGGRRHALQVHALGERSGRAAR